jgi:hypothetical protein
MAGLNLGLGGGVRLGGAAGSMTGAPATIAQTAYGSGQAANASSAGGIQTWHYGVLVPVVVTLFGVWLRWTLPR